MFKLFKRTIGVCLAGIGLGIILVLILPLKGWLFLIGIAILSIGVMWLFC